MTSLPRHFNERNLPVNLLSTPLGDLRQESPAAAQVQSQCTDALAIFVRDATTFANYARTGTSEDRTA